MDHLSQSTWDDEIDDQDHLGLDLPIVTSQAGTDDIFLGMVPGSIEGLHYHTGKVSIPSKYQVIDWLTNILKFDSNKGCSRQAKA